ncbi:MAG: hypothetical protein AAF723_07940 [Pseudomonadota bacterium]
MAQVDIAAARLSAALDRLETTLKAGGRPLPSVSPDIVNRIDLMETKIDQALQELEPFTSPKEGS